MKIFQESSTDSLMGPKCFTKIPKTGRPGSWTEKGQANGWKNRKKKWPTPCRFKQTPISNAQPWERIWSRANGQVPYLGPRLTPLKKLAAKSKLRMRTAMSLQSIVRRSRKRKWSKRELLNLILKAVIANTQTKWWINSCQVGLVQSLATRVKSQTKGWERQQEKVGWTHLKWNLKLMSSPKKILVFPNKNHQKIKPRS